MALTDAFSGAMPQGGTGYQKQVVANAAATSKPYYVKALDDAKQRAANSGQLSSGAGLASQGAVGEGYQANLGQISGQAAVEAAQLQEQERQRQQSHQWQVERDAKEREWQKELMRMRGDAEGAGRWNDLISGAAGAAGGMLGGPIGAVAGKGLYNWLSGSGQQLDENGVPLPPMQDPGVAAAGTY